MDAVFGWTGKYRDPLTGFQYNDARWYNPVSKRWLSEDWWGLAAGTNPNIYTDDDPVNFVDPEGFAPEMWFNDGWTDWINPFAWTGSIGYSIGETYGNVKYLGDDFERNRVGGERAILEAASPTSRTDPNEFRRYQAASENATGTMRALAEGSVQITAGAPGMVGASAAAKSAAAAAKTGSVAPKSSGSASAKAPPAKAAPAAQKASAPIKTAAKECPPPVTGKTAASSNTALARQLGRAGEEAVGITGPKVGIRIPGSNQLRFPDAISRTTLTEVKNVANLSYTRQLRDYAAFAAENNLKFNLFVRPTTRLSGPLLDAIDAELINLFFIP